MCGRTDASFWQASSGVQQCNCQQKSTMSRSTYVLLTDWQWGPSFIAVKLLTFRFWFDCVYSHTGWTVSDLQPFLYKATPRFWTEQQDKDGATNPTLFNQDVNTLNVKVKVSTFPSVVIVSFHISYPGAQSQHNRKCVTVKGLNVRNTF